jgi:hypothetical protein
MKRLLLLAILLLPFALSASSLPNCGSVPITWSTVVGWHTPTTGCQAGDIQLSNFQLTSGTIDTPNVTVTISTTGANSQVTILNMNDNNGFLNAFSMSYVVTIDFTANSVPPLSLGGMWAVVQASAGLQVNGNDSQATWTKVLSNGATGTSTVSDVNGSVPAAPPIFINSVSFLVTDTYTPVVGGQDILNLSNKFTQGPVPEPSTMLLLGGALIGLGVVGRKRRKNV